MGSIFIVGRSLVLKVWAERVIRRMRTHSTRKLICVWAASPAQHAKGADVLGTILLLTTLSLSLQVDLQ